MSGPGGVKAAGEREAFVSWCIREDIHPESLAAMHGWAAWQARAARENLQMTTFPATNSRERSEKRD